jgi:hypothetical protein
MVLESTAVRAAEAVLEADDAFLVGRLIALLEAVLSPGAASAGATRDVSSDPQVR